MRFNCEKSSLAQILKTADLKCHSGVTYQSLLARILMKAFLLKGLR